MSPRYEKPQRQVALMMSGGGALAAYQVGLLRCVARLWPDFAPQILTGVSAGAINAVALAALRGSFADRVTQLYRSWQEIEAAKVFRVDPASLLWRGLGWGMALVSGGHAARHEPRSFVDTQPLREFLTRQIAAPDGSLSRIRKNLAQGAIDAVAITASSYTTGASVTWVEGREATPWSRAHRISLQTELTVEHVMASSALPLLFPAVRLGSDWYCDGGVRLTAPLSPAIHLGADRILAISTRHQHPEQEYPRGDGYPPPAQIAGVLLNALFLDQLDADALRMQRINELLAELPEEKRQNLRHVEILILRPSQDLGELANEYEPRLPRTFRFLTRGLGTRQARRNDLLSLLMFQHDYIEHLCELGRRDAEARAGEIAAFLSGKPIGAS